MGRVNSRLKECASAMIGKAKIAGESKSAVPTFFDGSIDQYIGWLKYLKHHSELNGLIITMHLDGSINLKRK